jgi:hypothetical protein
MRRKSHRAPQGKHVAWASQGGDPCPGVHRQSCDSVSDNIALTGLHAHPEFHAEFTGSGRWTGWTKVHLATLRSDPSV